MKEKEILARYPYIDLYRFVQFLNYNGLPYKTTMSGELVVDDAYIEQFAQGFYQTIESEIKTKQEEEARKRKAMAEMLITSGFNFDGYTVTKYSGYISGDDAIAIPRGDNFWNQVNVKDKLMESLVIIRRNALNELKEAAYALGCNAIIGVDFDYLTLDPETATVTGGTLYQPYIFGVTANGNAVVIEKNK